MINIENHFEDFVEIYLRRRHFLDMALSVSFVSGPPALGPFGEGGGSCIMAALGEPPVKRV